MTAFLCKVLWLCQILATLQIVSCKQHKQAVKGDHGNFTDIIKRDTTLSHVQAIYNTYKSKTKSEVTYYGKYVGGGACALDPLSPMANQPGWIRVAAGKHDFQNSLGCGMCVEITGSGKGSGVSPVTGTFKAIVHDLCGGCKKGGFDLYISGDGRWEVTSRSIDCPTLQGPDGNIIFRFTGSNPWYIKLQARNIKVPVAGIEVFKNGKYSCLRRTSDNYFTGDGLGTVEFPMKVRVTAITGEQLEATLPSMKNDQNIPSDIQFAGISKGRGPSGIKCFGQGNKAPYPSGGMSPGKEGGPSPKVVGPSGGGTANQGPVDPLTGEKLPGNKVPSSGATNTGGNGEFCESRESGIYADPDDCQGFILCDAGKTHRKKCAQGLLFNPKYMVCDLPRRVKCTQDNDDKTNQAEKRGKLALGGKPAVEIVIQKEKTRETQTAPLRESTSEGIQAIRPNEEPAPESGGGKLEPGGLRTSQAGRLVASTSKEKEDGRPSEDKSVFQGGSPGLTTDASVEKQEGRASSEERGETAPGKIGGIFVPDMKAVDVSSATITLKTPNQKPSTHNNGWKSSQKGGLGTATSEVPFQVERISTSTEKGNEPYRPTKGMNVTAASQGTSAPVLAVGVGDVGAAAVQGGNITELPDNKIIPHQSGVGASETFGGMSAPKSGEVGSAVALGGALVPTRNVSEVEKQDGATTQQGNINRVPFKIEVAGQQLELHTETSKGAEKQVAVLPNGSITGPSGGSSNVSRQEQTKQETSNVNGINVVTSEGLKTVTSTRPAADKEKEKAAHAPLVGITIKQTGEPDKYVLVNKRHKLRKKHYNN